MNNLFCKTSDNSKIMFSSIDEQKEAIYFCDLIIPLDNKPIIPKGFIQTENGLIKAIGSQSEFCASDKNIIYLKNSIILPSFINAHTHLSYEYNYSSKKSIAWIEDLVKESRALSTEKKEEIALQNIQYIKNTGTKFIIENTPFAETIKALNHHKDSLQALIGLEAFGTEEKFDYYLNQIAQLEQEFPDLNFTFSPHSIYNVSAILLQKLTQWAKEENKPLLLHIAEFDFEFELTKTGYANTDLKQFYTNLNLLSPCLYPLKDLTPIKYLHKINCLNSNLFLTHVLKLDDGDLELLAQNKTKIIICSRSNAYLQNGIAKLKQIFDLGLSVCFATDGLCSNFDLNLVNEIKFTYLLHNANNYSISAQSLWEGITSVPAQILNLKDLGSLQINKKAVFNYLQLPDALIEKALNQENNIYEFLLRHLF